MKVSRPIVAVKLYLAGSLYLTIDDVPATTFHSLKTQALLAYVVLEGHKTLERDALAAIFWEGYTRKSGRANLRMSLSNLRQVLGSHSGIIETTRNTVRLNTDAENVWCDVLHVKKTMTAGGRGARHQLQARLNAFDRVLMPGFEEIDSSAFLDWLRAKRGEYASLIEQLRQPLRERHFQPTPKHNLPRMLKPIFGRQQAIDTLSTWLASAYHPLITLVGQGGVGKSELALAVARGNKANFPDGVWFIGLERVQSAESPEIIQNQVLQQIAQTMHFVPRGQGSLYEQITRYLQSRHVLLILDNFEHVIEAAPLVVNLLRETQQLNIILTSRQKLNDPCETVYFVNGLETGSGNDSPSVQLFCERLSRTGRQIDQDGELKIVADICQLLNGLPLGIELATSLCETQTLAELRTTLEHDLTFLKTDALTMPTRHRSLWAVIAYSWQQLTWEEQRVLLQLTIMRGAFSAEIAQSVTQSSQSTIVMLQHIGLLTTQQNGLLSLHPQISRFCLKRSENNAALNGWLTQAQYRHATTYLEWLVQQMAQLKRAPERIVEVQQQLPDIEQAWQWCINHNSANLLVKASLPLATYLDTTGLQATGIAWFEQALQITTNDIVNAYLRNALAMLYIAHGDYQAAQQQLVLLETIDDLPAVLRAQMKLLEGHLQYQQGQRAESVATYEHLAAAESADLRPLAISSAYHLGRIYSAERAWEAAETIWEKGYELACKADDLHYQALFCQALGQAAYNQTDYEVAWQRLLQGLALTSDELPLPDLYYYAALTAYQREDYYTAYQYILMALPIYQQQQLVQRTIDALELLNQLEHQLNMPTSASRHELRDLRQRSL